MLVYYHEELTIQKRAYSDNDDVLEGHYEGSCFVYLGMGVGYRYCDIDRLKLSN
jgi:hypothetical protein